MNSFKIGKLKLIDHLSDILGQFFLNQNSLNFLHVAFHQ